MLIDRISYRNPLKNINPIVKIIFTIISLIILLSINKKEIFIFNIIVFNLILLFGIKVTFKELVKLYKIPLFFILTTMLTLLFIKSEILNFLLRSFGGISIVYALICSTPIIDLDYAFYKLKMPKIFRELFLLIYKYIFIFSDLKEKLINTQSSRLGYVKYKNSIKSFSMLVVAIFQKIEYYGINATKALESRNGTEFLFVHREYKKIGKEVIFVVIICLINLFLVVKNYV